MNRLLLFLAVFPLITISGQPQKAAIDPGGKNASDRLTAQMQRLNQESRARNDFAKLKNARIEQQIAEREGKPFSSQAVDLAEARVAADKRAGLHPEMQVDPLENMALLSMLMDCQQAVIEKHNVEYPKHQWADVKDIRDMLNGPPDKERIASARKCADMGGSLAPNGALKDLH